MLNRLIRLALVASLLTCWVMSVQAENFTQAVFFFAGSLILFLDFNYWFKLHEGWRPPAELHFTLLIFGIMRFAQQVTDIGTLTNQELWASLIFPLFLTLLRLTVLLEPKQKYQNHGRSLILC